MCQLCTKTVANLVHDATKYSDYNHMQAMTPWPMLVEYLVETFSSKPNIFSTNVFASEWDVFTKKNLENALDQ